MGVYLYVITENGHYVEHQIFNSLFKAVDYIIDLGYEFVESDGYAKIYRQGDSECVLMYVK